MQEQAEGTKLHLGTAWYPEHWPEDRWSEDIRLMQAAGLTVVRMAEFAWSSLESPDGQFCFDWLDRAIEKLAAARIQTVLGTPTAAPPAWLTQAHPDILAMDENGRRVQVGNRCHYCVNSTEYHEAAIRISNAMAEHYGPNPNVIGWQIDNEYNRVCYCDSCRSLFQQFLANKYASLEVLNRCWSTAYWSQTYSDWKQIPIPVGWHNPGLQLEFKNFVTDSYAKFQRIQIDAIRPFLKPGVWTTHNFMGWFNGFNHYRLSADLDMASWDAYVGNGHHDHLNLGITHDLTRGFKRRNFWVMETQPGAVNWSPLNNSLYQGEARAMAWQAVAHGAEAVLYWQWRTALGGQEQYHGTLVDTSGRPRPFYTEIRQLGEEFARLSDLITNSEIRAEAALLNDYESRWSIEFQPHHKDFDYLTYFNHFARSLASHGIALDVISADAGLDGYRLVIAPALILLDENRVQNLTGFLRRGGHLVLTARCGMKDRHNALLPSRQPGPLAQAAGVEVEEFFALDEVVPVKGNGIAGTAKIWAERLRVLDEQNVTVMARYQASNGWLDGQAAISMRAKDESRVYYIGAWLDDDTQQLLIGRILSNAGLSSIETPPGVEFRTRSRPDGQEIHFLINHERKNQSVNLPWEVTDHLSGGRYEKRIDLPPYEVAILTRDEKAAR